MNIKLKYGDQVMTLPVNAVHKAIAASSREQLALLLIVADNQHHTVSEISDKLNITQDEVIGALTYWQSNGVLNYSLDKDEATPQTEVVAPKKKRDNSKQYGNNKKDELDISKLLENKPLASADEVPAYSLEQIADFLEKNPSASNLIACCSQILGKFLTPAETNILVGLMDYAALSPDYIMLLCLFSVETGKRSVRYIEKTALSLHDSGITNYHELEAYIEKKRLTLSLDGELRKIFGIGQRALTKRETECFFRWVGEWRYTIDVISEAYEITVTNTSEPSVPYTDAILKNWHDNGYSTVDEIHRALDEYKKSKAAAERGTFNTDDFFEAALKRSYT